MKTIGIAALYLGTTIGLNSLAAGGASALSSVNTANVPPPSPYKVIETGPNHRIWQRETYEPMPGGQIATHIHSYTELASGLNYQDSTGKWVPSQAKIETFAGGAVARHGQHQVIFANNLNTAGAIDEQTPDGKRLRSNILGLMYFDPSTGQAVQIAQLQDSEGELIADDKVIYPNAFAGVQADVLFTYRLDGMEQDVILREQPPTPEAYGMNPDTAELEVFTEFINPPTANIMDLETDNQESDIDQAIGWGATSLGKGRAFSIGGEDVPATVTKRYAIVNGRHFLLEKVKLQNIQQSLSTLPQQSSNIRRLPGLASTHFKFPKGPSVKSVQRPMRLAQSPPANKGYVLDYVSLNASYTNFVFQGDTTYYISGNINLVDTNFFDGGTVIKYAANTSIALGYAGSVQFLSKPYRPVVFTAKDDDSVGQAITGSSGNPSGYYANPALNLNSMGSFALSEFRISYANLGITITGDSPDTISDAQWVKCGTAVSGVHGTLALENALFSSVKTNFNTASSVNYISVQNATFNNIFDLVDGNYSSTSFYLTNCVFVNTTNLSGTIYAGYNGFYCTPEVGSTPVTNTFFPLLTAGAASCYLTNGCAFFDAGTTNIDSADLKLIGAKTTYPPIIYSNIILTTAMTFSPQAPRDSDIPDLGYHYDPLDYVFGGDAQANSNLTFTAGTAAGFFYVVSGADVSLWMEDNTTASFNGTVTSPCCWARYNTVQEGGNGNWTAQSYMGGIVGDSFTTAAPAVQANFTGGYELAAEGNLFRDCWILFVIKAQNCEFYSGGFGGYVFSLNFTNCLLANTAPGIWDNYGAANLSMQNCTVFRGNLTADNTSGTAWPVRIVNCAFDQTTLYMNAHGGTTNGYYSDYNSFLQYSNRTAYSGPHDLTITNSYYWQTSWLGSFYQPTNSLLIDKGNTTADLLGLYHFTTQTNQIKETNSTVDIGYHYVAVDTNGIPIDTNGDGIPDYIEDANGNGLVDSGEIGWNIFGDLGLKVYITWPRNGSTLP